MESVQYSSHYLHAGVFPQAQKLKNVLLAYSRHNKNVGYCQVIGSIIHTFMNAQCPLFR